MSTSRCLALMVQVVSSGLKIKHVSKLQNWATQVLFRDPGPLVALKVDKAEVPCGTSERGPICCHMYKISFKFYVQS